MYLICAASIIMIMIDRSLSDPVREWRERIEKNCNQREKPYIFGECFFHAQTDRKIQPCYNSVI